MANSAPIFRNLTNPSASPPLLQSTVCSMQYAVNWSKMLLLLQGWLFRAPNQSSKVTHLMFHPNSGHGCVSFPRIFQRRIKPEEASGTISQHDSAISKTNLPVRYQNWQSHGMRVYPDSCRGPVAVKCRHQPHPCANLIYRLEGTPFTSRILYSIHQGQSVPCSGGMISLWLVFNIDLVLTTLVSNQTFQPEHESIFSE